MNPETTNTASPATGPIDLNEPMMTADEVAALLRLEPRTVVRMAQAGRILAVRVDGKGSYRFPRHGVAAYIAANTVPTQQVA
jgi:excisionase family DNA binding protein